jgi:hypothetical protein
LYRNTFQYHSVSAVPGAPRQVPLEECVAFIGAPRLRTWRCTRLRRASGQRGARWTAARRRDRTGALTRALRAAAEEAYAAGEKVLVHCMSGSSRCARASGARGRARSAQAQPPCALLLQALSLRSHCRSSASVAIAFLIKRHRWRLAHCHAWLKERRPGVNVQPGASSPHAAQ